MAEQENTLSQVTEGTTELLHQATEKTAKTVIEHTSKYNDAYSTIDKIMEGFWERVPYFCITDSHCHFSGLLSKLFKFLSVRL